MKNSKMIIGGVVFIAAGVALVSYLASRDGGSALQTTAALGDRVVANQAENIQRRMTRGDEIRVGEDGQGK